MDPVQSSALTLAVKEVRQGVYKEYEVDVLPQAVDNADGTYKTAKETAKGKNKYVGVLGVLIIGSFIIPMAQYFWYVREE